MPVPTRYVPFNYLQQGQPIVEKILRSINFSLRLVISADQMIFIKNMQLEHRKIHPCYRRGICSYSIQVYFAALEVS